MPNRIIALCGVLVFTLVGVWRLRPRSPATFTVCARAVVIVHDRRSLLQCVDAPEVRTADLLRRAGIHRCEGVGVVRVGQQVETSSAPRGCTTRVSPLTCWHRMILGIRIDLNQATRDDLEQLPRIGPVLARRIVADRTRRGPFATLDQLGRVRGIGPATVARLEPLVTVRPAPRPRWIRRAPERRSRLDVDPAL